MLMGGCTWQRQVTIQTPDWPGDLPFDLGNPGYQTPSCVATYRKAGLTSNCSQPRKELQVPIVVKTLCHFQIAEEREEHP